MCYVNVAEFTNSVKMSGRVFACAKTLSSSFQVDFFLEGYEVFRTDRVYDFTRVYGGRYGSRLFGKWGYPTWPGGRCWD